MIKNSKGKVFYGLHFYPGVAQYSEDGKEPYRVFLNEDTLRKMDPTFAGRPIFVEHVDEVDPDLNKLRTEAEGWVVESFFNSADGCHWVKFMTVTDEAERAIRNGHKLSNAYIPKSFKDGGLWNGVPYQKEITDGEFEHLALVKTPRYEESIILTPDEFKQYNEEKVLELKKLSNSKEKEKKTMFTFFKKTKVENAIDTDLQIVLPKSGKTMSLNKLINEYDDKMKKDAYKSDEDPAMDKKAVKDDKGGESAKSHSMADMDHMVKMHDGSYMKVKDMMNKFKAMNDDMDDMKKEKKDSKGEELDLEVKEKAVDEEGDLHNDPASEHDMDDHEEKVQKVEHKEEMKDSLLEDPEEVVHDDEDPAEDKKAKGKALQLAEHEDKEIKEAKAKNKKKNDLAAKEKADRLRNAHNKVFENNTPEQVIELSYDRVQRGVERYGS
jgi:hypothetical protein